MPLRTREGAGRPGIDSTSTNLPHQKTLIKRYWQVLLTSWSFLQPNTEKSNRHFVFSYTSGRMLLRSPRLNDVGLMTEQSIYRWSRQVIPTGEKRCRTRIMSNYLAKFSTSVVIAESILLSLLFNRAAWIIQCNAYVCECPISRRAHSAGARSIRGKLLFMLWPAFLDARSYTHTGGLIFQACVMVEYEKMCVRRPIIFTGFTMCHPWCLNVDRHSSCSLDRLLYGS